MRICFRRVALDRAAVLLRMKREIFRLDNVWGVGGGQRPVKHLIKEVKVAADGSILRHLNEPVWDGRTKRKAGMHVVWTARSRPLCRCVSISPS